MTMTAPTHTPNQTTKTNPDTIAVMVKSDGPSVEEKRHGEKRMVFAQGFEVRIKTEGTPERTTWYVGRSDTRPDAIKLAAQYMTDHRIQDARSSVVLTEVWYRFL